MRLMLVSVVLSSSTERSALPSVWLIDTHYVATGRRAGKAVPAAVHVPVTEAAGAVLIHPLTHFILLGSAEGPTVMLVAQSQEVKR